MELLQTLLFSSFFITVSSQSVWRYSNCPESCQCEMRESKHFKAELRTVDCSRRGLTAFPSVDSIPTDTQVLLLNHNKIHQAQPDLRVWLVDLLQLDLSHNRLNRIGRSTRFSLSVFEGLYNLQVLDLSHNQMRNIGNNAFQGLYNLQDLNLSRNRLTAIMDDAFKGLHNLKTLRINQNRVTFIQHTWWLNTPQLLNLHLSGNHLSLIQSDSFKPLHQLRALELSQNRIFRINENAFFGLDNLENLQISGNSLTTVPRAAIQLIHRSLVSLNLGRNPIFKLSTDDFANLPLLKDISLTSMPRLRLAERGAFKNLPQLLVLQLHDNPFLAYLDGNAFVNTPELTNLFLHNNNLTVLEPQTLASFPSLEEISFYGNPLACDCNSRWLKQFLADKSPEAVVFNEAERMVCASPEVHKFKLFSSLQPTDFPKQCGPRILYMFDPVNARKLGEDIALDCRAVGLPKPRISWITPDGSVLAPSTYHPRRVLRNGNTLILQHVTLQDAGLYTCVAESDAGYAAVQTFLNVSNIQVTLFSSAVESQSATLVWKGKDRSRNIFQLLFKETRSNSPHRYAGTVTPVMRTYTMSDLRPNTEYEVCLAFQDGHNILSHVSCTKILTKHLDPKIRGMERTGNVAVGVALAAVAAVLILMCLTFVGLKRSSLSSQHAAYDNLASLSNAERGNAYSTTPRSVTVSLERVPLHLSTENVYSPLVGGMVPVSRACKLEH